MGDHLSQEIIDRLVCERLEQLRHLTDSQRQVATDHLALCQQCRNALQQREQKTVVSAVLRSMY